MYKSIIALFIAAGVLPAAEIKFYTLPEVAKTVLLRNTDRVISSNGLIVSRNKYQAAVNKFFLPDIRLSVDSPLTVSGDYNGSNAYTLGTNYYLVGTLALEQKLPWDMLIRVEGNYKFTGLPALSNAFAASLTVTQPLFKRNDDGYTAESTEKDYAMALRSFVQSERDVLYSTESGYYDLVTGSTSLNITRRRLVRSATNLVDTGNKFKAGLINEITYLRLTQNYRKSLAALEQQELTQRAQKTTLALLMNTTNTDYTIDLTLPYAPVDYDKERSIARSLSNDVTLLSLDLSVWKEQMALRKTLDSYNPNGSIALTASRDYAANYDIGLRLNMSTAVFERFNRDIAIENSSLTVSNYQMQMADRRNEVRSIIDKTIENLANIKKNIEINEESLAIARKTLSIDEERFTLGLISSDTLIKTEDDYYDTELALLTQKISYLKAVSTLENKYWMVRAGTNGMKR